MAPFGLWIMMTVSEALIDFYFSIPLHLSHQAAIYILLSPDIDLLTFVNQKIMT